VQRAPTLGAALYGLNRGMSILGSYLM
jgi:hypothetical protein